MSEPIPSVFVSHGSPALVLGESPVRAFLRGLGVPDCNRIAVPINRGLL